MRAHCISDPKKGHQIFKIEGLFCYWITYTYYRVVKLKNKHILRANVIRFHTFLEYPFLQHVGFCELINGSLYFWISPDCLSCNFYFSSCCILHKELNEVKIPYGFIHDTKPWRCWDNPIVLLECNGVLTLIVRLCA